MRFLRPTALRLCFALIAPATLGIGAAVAQADEGPREIRSDRREVRDDDQDIRHDVYEVRHDRRELRGDMRELRRDEAALAHDRAEMRAALARGDWWAARRERAEI